MSRFRGGQGRQGGEGAGDAGAAGGGRRIRESSVYRVRRRIASRAGRGDYDGDGDDDYDDDDIAEDKTLS